MKKKLIILFICTICSLLIFSCEATGQGLNDKGNTNSNTEVIQVLEHYLKARSAGQYDACEQYFTGSLLTYFIQMYDINCTGYFRTRESFYWNAEIIDVTPKNDGFVIRVTVDIEDPGVITPAVETYHMVKEKGTWKINDWKVEDK